MSKNQKNASSSGVTPSTSIKEIIGQPVSVKLFSGLEYRGILACMDGYLNIAMEQTEEYVDGTLTKKYGDVFLRGNNIYYIGLE